MRAIWVWWLMACRSTWADKPAVPNSETLFRMMLPCSGTSRLQLVTTCSCSTPGGFPAFYGEQVQSKRSYAAAVAEAGHIAAEVLLVNRKSADDMHRWVHLDIGRFSGLAGTEGEAIRYQFVTPHDGGDTGPCVMAWPNCDSADILYEKRPINLPLALRHGDKVMIRNCGAYTSSYSSVGFNGFPPLDVIVL